MIHTLVLLVLLVSSSFCLAEEDIGTYKTPTGFLPTVGSKLPSFELARLEGGTATLESFAGRPLVVTFFFSDCAPCVRDVGELNSFLRSNPGYGVVAITFDTVERAGQFVTEYGLQWPVLVEAQAYFDQIGVLAFPAFALLDENGHLLGATYGNRLGGEDGTVTAKGLESWVKLLAPEA